MISFTCSFSCTSQNKSSLYSYPYVCLFFGVVHPNPEIFTHLETSPLTVKATKFDQYSALMAINHWGFFNVPHLWHGPTVYNSHRQGPVTLTPVAEYLAVELSLPVLRWYGTYCNIYKDERILKSNYDHHFKNFKIYYICPKIAFLKFDKRDKNFNTGARFEPVTHGLLDYTNSLSYTEIYQILDISNYVT